MGAERVTDAGDTAHAFGGGAAAADARSPVDGVVASSYDLSSLIVELAPDGILIVDVDGAISFANPAAAAIFGYHRQDLTGLTMDELVPGCLEGEHGGRWQSSGLEPGPRPIGARRDLLGRGADGSEVPVEISLSPVTLGGRAATIAIVRPVPAHRAVESELRKRLLLEEDERIAAELQDRVIKRLFLAGMKIQSILTLTETPVYQQLNETVDQLDKVIHDIRHTVFADVLAGGDPEPPRSMWS